MLVEYNYDEGLKVLELHKNAQLVTLELHKIDNEDKYVMEYTTMQEYDEDTQEKIRNTLSKALSVRIHFSDLFNKFIEKKALNQINIFEVSYDANRDIMKCYVTHSLFGPSITPASSVDILKKHLDAVQASLTAMGSMNLLSGTYIREGSGRKRKYVQLSLGDMIDIIKQNLQLEGDSEYKEIIPEVEPVEPPVPTEPEGTEENNEPEVPNVEEPTNPVDEPTNTETTETGENTGDDTGENTEEEENGEGGEPTEQIEEPSTEVTNTEDNTEDVNDTNDVNDSTNYYSW